MRISLDFMICPDELGTKCYVPDAVRIKIINPSSIFITGMLGESGRKMINGGCEFFFTRKLAKEFIKRKIAVKVKERK